MESFGKFKNTLTLLRKKGLSNVRAIIWTMNPGIESNELESQANFINQLAPKWIWDRVIIILKKALNLVSQSQKVSE